MTDVWRPGSGPPFFHPREIAHAAERVREPVCIVHNPAGGGLGVAFGGHSVSADARPDDRPNDRPDGEFPVVGMLPPLYPEWLGDRTFLEAHGVRFPYVTGAMANGIAAPPLVVAMARAGMLGFLGCAGLSLERVEQGLSIIQAELGGLPCAWGANLIHSPGEPGLEDRLVDLYLSLGVRHVEASAFMALQPSVVRYAYRGVRVDSQGRVQRPNRVLAKVSRSEVAAALIAPAPAAMLEKLVAENKLSPEEARLGARLPVAEDITAEADSGGHTDNRPLTVLLPLLLQVRDELCLRHGYTRPVRVGAAGGLGTPNGVAAAFALGAAYVLTGSVNQASREAALSDAAKALLARAEMADVTMAPAADMFEMGIKVQVLKRGTLFASRAALLYDLYRRYDSLESIPPAERAALERDLFRQPFEQVWDETRRFWQTRDPATALKAETDAHTRMGLVFRWYLGKASRWAIAGDADRTLDYQLWCGPAMGAFNHWVRGSFLEDWRNRTATQIALNLLEGAAVVTRAAQFRSYGVPVPNAAFDFRPRPLACEAVHSDQPISRTSAPMAQAQAVRAVTR